jgi:pimeloyl-ACP methyl ester carboxylesterase
MAEGSRRPVTAPPAALLLLEIPRAAFELGNAAAAGALLRRVRRGDGHGVLVLPGLGGADGSTAVLRWLLRDLGYRAEGWGLGRNLGPTPAVVDALPRRLGALAERTGGPVTLVGWSLGGIYARELARGLPDQVRAVITLGSPFQMRLADQSNASYLWTRLRRFHQRGLPGDPALDDERPPLPVPTTAIYSRTDGIVRWHTCIDTVSESCENVEVRGSHIGLGHNPAALYVIADRLAQPPGRWTPFTPPGVLRPLYPTATSWDPRRRAGPQP